MLNRNLLLLILCQLIAAAGSIVLVTLGGIIGADLTDNPAFATLPVSFWVISMALTSVPAALIMRRIGRARGFALAALSAAIAVSIALLALRNASFVGFLVAAAIFGINMAFAQQYRFAAIESVAPQYAGRAVSWVLLGAVGGAILGPGILKATTQASEAVPYGTTMLWLAGLYLLSAVAALFLQPAHADHQSPADAIVRPLRVMARQRLFVIAVLGATVGYGVMAFVMTATPLSMHKMDGFSLQETADVIRAHVFGMYLPSLVSGYLIDRFGVIRMMVAGAIVLAASLIVGMSGHALDQYWISLVLLGVGWNFLYVGGTTMLTYTYTPAERFRAQAINEFCVFGTAAAGSLLAGTIMYWFGWFTTVAAPLPLLAAILLGLFIVRHDPQLKVADRRAEA